MAATGPLGLGFPLDLPLERAAVAVLSLRKFERRSSPFEWWKVEVDWRPFIRSTESRVRYVPGL